MAALAAGQTLHVLVTDPEAPVDLAAWASDEGHRYSHKRHLGFTECLIRRAGG